VHNLKKLIRADCIANTVRGGLYKTGIKKRPVTEEISDGFFESIMKLPSSDEVEHVDLADFKHVNTIYRIDDGSCSHIWYDDEKKGILYDIVEPELDDTTRFLLDYFKKLLYGVLDDTFSEITDVSTYLDTKFDSLVSNYQIELGRDQQKKMRYYLKRDMAGYDRITPLMNDPNIEDISLDGANIPIYVYHRIFGSIRSNVMFPGALELDSFTLKLAQKCGRYISISTPILDGSLPDGSRVHLTLGKEVSMKGSTAQIRKFSIEPITPPDLVNFGSIDPIMLAYLWILIENKSSILVAGEVATGKTTLLNAFSLFIPANMKIISIEDTPEVRLPHENWIQGVTRTGLGNAISGVSGIASTGEITMLDLLKGALRQRPDYIIVGEVRGEEANVLFQAIATGHLALSTIHANSPRAVLHRLQSKPMNIPKIMLDSLNCVCMQIRVKYRGNIVRRTRKITEILGYDINTDTIQTKDIFTWDPVDDTFNFSGKSNLLEKIAHYSGVDKDIIYKELDARASLIQWLIDSRINDYIKVAHIISEYYMDPEQMLQRIENETR